MMQQRCPVGLLILTLLYAMLAVGPVWADDGGAGAGGERWSLSLGTFDLPDNDRSLEAGIEYRFQPFELWTLDFIPAVGFSATTDESFWVYGGLRHDIALGDRWVVTPQFGISLYEDGDGKDLGGVIEFRSGIEIGRHLKRGGRVGLLFYHLSNARIYDLNPGQESLLFTWSW